MVVAVVVAVVIAVVAVCLIYNKTTVVAVVGELVGDCRCR